MRRTPDWFRSTHLVACCLCWAIGSVLFACGAPERDETPAERAPSTTADDPRLLRVAIVPAPVSTDPRTPRSPGRLDLVRYLYPALLSVKADPDGTVRFERDLATRWTWDKVEHRLVVDLSARRRWSNGAPIVAEDVAESFRWHLRNGRSSGTADLREVTAPQPGQVSLSFRENVSERRALRIACAPILSAGERAPASGRTLRGEEPVLGGAVRLAARDAHSLVLVPSGVTDAMRIPGILLETVPGADARLLRVAAGVSDLALDVPVHVIRDLGLGNGVIHDAGPGGV
ncbi:MAG: hypothetical protein KC729_15315, partial [Candidatus Eisenbacteria bacterium]|nr:hypothetical protein [Candidatus Eisenbacteria bacterium]